MIMGDGWHKVDCNRFVNSAKGSRGLLNLKRNLKRKDPFLGGFALVWGAEQERNRKKGSSIDF